ncbi:hypothetical protein AVEN_133712-1 [Araneus ventricosus]|uniref:Uncharacterized protein n=1 Tax=Araneus ventricosus TaxID=182803 RepID=A0A4Y2B9Q4_ARAVE|nr:hypothetical protein AVEN_133712-1 [Araneus ventricosus]
MKRASSESASSTTPVKKPSTFNNTGGFTADSIPQHHYYLGEDNYAVISDFGDVLNVHIRKFKTNENGRIFPTKNGVSFSPYVWESLVTEMDNSSLPSETGKVLIVRDTLFLSTAWIEDKPFISFQRYVTKVNFSRQFLPSVCLLTETEWDQLQFIRKKISDSCKSLMFGNFLKKIILLEVSSRSKRTNLQMNLSDIEMVLSTSLTEILADNIRSRIDDVLVYKGCLENQANQLGHDCVTMNFESRHCLYGDLAILSIDIELLVKEFVDKMRRIDLTEYLLASSYDEFIDSGKQYFLQERETPLTYVVHHRLAILLDTRGTDVLNLELDKPKYTYPKYDALANEENEFWDNSVAGNQGHQASATLIPHRSPLATPPETVKTINREERTVDAMQEKKRERKSARPLRTAAGIEKLK